MQIPRYALEDRELWTEKRVREALVQAFITVERSVGRVGPRAPRSGWTHFALDPADIWEQRRTGSNEIGRKARPQITAKAIQRAELVLEGGRLPGGVRLEPWLSGMLAVYPKLRTQLEVWVLHELGKEFGWTRRSIKELCEACGWARSSFDRNISTAASVVAHRLNLAGLDIW